MGVLNIYMFVCDTLTCKLYITHKRHCGLTSFLVQELYCFCCHQMSPRSPGVTRGRCPVGVTELLPNIVIYSCFSTPAVYHTLSILCVYCYNTVHLQQHGGSITSTLTNILFLLFFRLKSVLCLRKSLIATTNLSFQKLEIL